MANINIVGFNLTTGQMQPVGPADVPTSTSGSPILGGTGLSGITGLQGLEGITGLGGITGVQGLVGSGTGIQGNTGIAGGTGVASATPTLNQILTASNITGDKNIIVSSGQAIRGATGFSGGDLSLNAGVGTTGIGGSVTVTATAGTGGNAGGDARLTAGGSISGQGGAAYVTGGASAGGGGAANIAGGAATGGVQVGGNVNITGGASGTNTPGGVVITGGTATSGVGGLVSMVGGAATSGVGGTASLKGGAGFAGAQGGWAEVKGGVGGTTGPGGDVYVYGGDAGVTGPNQGGACYLVGGTGKTTGPGGGVNITGGPGGANGIGGIASVTGGAGGGTSGAGGAASLIGGNATAGASAGGAVNITAGAATTSGAGGIVTISSGVSPSGTGGNILFKTGTTGLANRWSISNTGFFQGKSNTSSINWDTGLGTPTFAQILGPSDQGLFIYGGETASGTGPGVTVAGGSSLSGAGGEVLIVGRDASAGGYAGGRVRVFAGNSTGAVTGGVTTIAGGSAVNGIGGSATVKGGDGTSSGSIGGAAYLRGGDGGTTSGAAYVQGGTPTTATYAGGAVFIEGGNGLTSGAGGTVTISSGVSPSGTAGSIIFKTGTTSSVARFSITNLGTLLCQPAGPVYQIVGPTDASLRICSNVSSGGIGQNLVLQANSSTAAGAGGNIYLAGGTALTSGAGGAIYIDGGTSGGDGNAGGAITITGGPSPGTGSGGAVTVRGGTANTGTGGAVTIGGGSAVVNTYSGGNTFVVAGDGLTSGAGGTVTISSGVSPSGTAGSIIFKTGTTTSTRGAQIDNGGTLIIGDGTQGGFFSGGPFPAYSHVSYRGGTSNYTAWYDFSNTAAECSWLQFIRGRGTTASYSAVTSGDTLGKLSFYGFVNAGTTGQAASIEVVADGSVGIGPVMPGRMIFSTTLAGAGTPVERMSINNAGIVYVGNGVTALSPAAGIISGTGGSGAAIGGALTVRAGAGGSSLAGGLLTLAGGTATDGAGGGVTVAASPGVTGNNIGGALGLSAGDAVGSGAGGTVTISSGVSPSGTAGSILFKTGTTALPTNPNMEFSRFGTLILRDGTVTGPPAGWNPSGHPLVATNSWGTGTTSGTGGVARNQLYIHTVYDDAPAASPLIYMTKTRGTPSAPTNTGLGDLLGGIIFMGFDTATGIEFSSTIKSFATETATAAGCGGDLRFTTTPNTTFTPVERLRINQDGIVYVGNGVTTGSPVADGIISGTGGSGAAIGGALTVRAGAGGSSLAGGLLTLAGGTATDGAGGGVTVAASPGVTGNNIGGALGLSAGDAVGSGAGGTVTISSGVSPSGTAGSIIFKTGTVTSAQRMQLSNLGTLFNGTGAFSTIDGGGAEQPTTSYRFSSSCRHRTYVVSNTAADYPDIWLGRYSGTTEGTAGAVRNNDILGLLTICGGTGEGTTAFSGGYIGVVATEAWSGTAAGARMSFGVGATGSKTCPERLRINPTGTVVAGASDQTTLGIPIATNDPFRVQANTNAIVRQIACGAGVSNLHNLMTARGTLAVPTTLSDGDLIGSFGFQGCVQDGTGLYGSQASINVEADGTQTSTSGPGRIRFYTALAGGLSAFERLQINNAGVVYIGNGSTAASPNAGIISGTGHSGAGAGAAITLRGGLGGATSGAGGAVNVTGGAVTTTSASDNGGAVNVTGGSCSGTTTTGAGGAVVITGGSGGTTSGNGGDVSIEGGSVTAGNGGSISLQGANAAGTNKPGGSITLTGGNSTGNGAGGNISLESGTGGRVFVKKGGTLTRAIFNGEVSLTDNVATTVATVNIASNEMAGGTLRYSIQSSDGTDFQVLTGSLTFSAVDKGGALTSDIDEETTQSLAVSAGTLTDTWTINDGTNLINIQVQADTSLTPTSFICYVTLEVWSATATASVP